MRRSTEHAFRTKNSFRASPSLYLPSAVVQWMWDNTDKYVARAIDIEGVSRGDKAMYTVLEEFGQLGVVQKECEGSVSWPAQASPVVMSHDYTAHYGRWIYPEKRGKPPDADGEVAIRHVGPYMEHPIPRSAACLLCVDMRLGRRADARGGLFTQLEAALRAATQKAQKAQKAQRPKVRKRSRGKFSKSKSRSATSRKRARGGTRSRCERARRGRCATARREGNRRARSRRARSRGARRS